MQRILSLATGLASPAILIALVWCSLLVVVAIGPLEYPGQPSLAVLALAAAGTSLFILASGAGARCFASWCRREARLLATPVGTLNNVVLATSLIGLSGIGLVALDRLVFSGVSNSGYAELLRCAPDLVDFIAIKRTPALYAGYLMFSFGYASLVLFLLKGEEIRGAAAIVAQVSIISPVGYALIYSGRMPILLILVFIAAAVLVRISQGRSALPRGHYLLLKVASVVVLFAIYSSATWSSRQNFCLQMKGVMEELQQRRDTREQAAGEQRPSSSSSIAATEVSKMVNEAKKLPAPLPQESSSVSFLESMDRKWNVRPRGYVLSAMEAGSLSPGAAQSILSTYFYLTHGVRCVDITWRARETFSPNWGLYEVAILAPLLRVFFSRGDVVADLERQLKAVGIFGFFPTVWAAVFIDFGLIGSVFYILIWGFVAGWSAAGARRSALVTPPLLLVFVLASILLSPVQAPLGVANSALVLFSLLVTGMAIDLMALHGLRKRSRELDFAEPT